MGPVNETPPRPAARRIALFGNFGTGNLGNEGSLEALLVWLRHAAPDADLTCVCNKPERVRADHGIKSISVRADPPTAPWFKVLNRALLGLPKRLVDFGATIRLARSFDAVLVPGTGVFDDFGERWHAMPYSLFKWGLAARIAGAPLAYVSVGAGPIGHPVSRWLMNSAARLAHFRSYRDALSKEFMASIGVDTRNDPVFPDLAFSLPVPAAVPPTSRNIDELTVGVGVMSYYGWNQCPDLSARIHATYVAKIEKLVLQLLQRGYGVRLIVGSEADLATVNRISASVRSATGESLGARLLAEPAKSLHDVMRQMAETDVVIATRFHNVVCALMMAKPVISLGYAQKNDVLLDDMGLGDFCQGIEDIDSERLAKQLEKLIEGRERYAGAIRQRTEEYRKLLASQQEILMPYIAP